MNRRIITIILAAFTILATFGCSRPKEIPGKDLQKILRESFLANAYYNLPGNIMTDSLDVYRPILKKYGYDFNDLQYTMQEMGKRKSARLADVINDVKVGLESELKVYSERVAVLDTIDAVAIHNSKREVYFKDQIKITRIADTADLRINIPVNEGRYIVSYKFLIDSSELNTNLRTTYTLHDNSGQTRKAGDTYLPLVQRRPLTPVTVETQYNDSLLVILLGNYPKEKMKNPGLTIDSLKVEFTLYKEAALDSLLRSYMPTIPYHDEKLSTAAANRSPLRLDSLGADPAGSNNP